MVRLYSLETLVDNSAFKAYKSLLQAANSSYNMLYQSQRNFDLVAMADNSQHTLYYSSLCDSSVFSTLTTSVKLFPISSYSVAECQSILDTVLV